jgi:hypothetical protein
MLKKFDKCNQVYHEIHGGIPINHTQKWTEFFFNNHIQANRHLELMADEQRTTADVLINE